eukprot:Skav221474  [mRNA]  locus=scaffold1700:473812:481159:+ [translate_table: standard]
MSNCSVLTLVIFSWLKRALDWRLDREGDSPQDSAMAGAQTSEVDAVLKGFLTDFPSIIGFVVINADGIPTKWHESMPYDRAVMYAALMSDLLGHCKKSLRELLTSPAESELTNIRLRTKQGTEIICVTQVEYTLVVIQNCTGVPIAQDDETNAPGRSMTAVAINCGPGLTRAESS